MSASHDVELILFTITRWQDIPTNNAPDEHASIQWFDADDLAKVDLVDPALLAPAIAALADRT